MAHGTWYMAHIAHMARMYHMNASIKAPDELNVTARQDGPITLRLNARSGMKLTLLGPKAQVQGAYHSIPQGSELLLEWPKLSSGGSEHP